MSLSSQRKDYLTQKNVLSQKDRSKSLRENLTTKKGAFLTTGYIFRRISHQNLILSMQALTSIEGKLLLLVYQMHQEKRITKREKGILKDMIVSGNNAPFAAYQRYEREGTELTLISDLLHILRREKDNETQENSSQDSFRPRSSLMVIKIPKRNIQKLSFMQNRI